MKKTKQIIEEANQYADIEVYRYTTCRRVVHSDYVEGLDVCRQLRALRQERGLTTRQLADITGLGQAHIVRIENGKYNVRVGTLATIAEALNAEVNICAKKLFTVRNYRIEEVCHLRGKLYRTSSGEEVVVAERNIFSDRTEAEKALSSRQRGRAAKEARLREEEKRAGEMHDRLLTAHPELRDIPLLNIVPEEIFFDGEEV